MGQSFFSVFCSKYATDHGAISVGFIKYFRKSVGGSVSPMSVHSLKDCELSNPSKKHKRGVVPIERNSPFFIIHPYFLFGKVGQELSKICSPRSVISTPIGRYVLSDLLLTSPILIHLKKIEHVGAEGVVIDSREGKR